MRFTKMHGIGNDFVMLDLIAEQFSVADLPSFARKVCDRRFGVGADGLILLEKEESRFRMRMLNPDGSESQMCGNGLRCFAVLLRENGHVKTDSFPVETGAGTLFVDLESDRQVAIDMGMASVGFIDQLLSVGHRGTSVSMGNPHVVIFGEEIKAIDLAQEGPSIEKAAEFPERTNVHFVQVVNRHELIQRTWERGAGITLACGTGACAVGVAGFVNGLSDRAVTVHLPGGDLQIEYLENGHVRMAGPAEIAFVGNL